MLYDIITKVLLVEYILIAIVSTFVRPSVSIYWYGACILQWGVIIMGSK